MLDYARLEQIVRKAGRMAAGHWPGHGHAPRVWEKMPGDPVSEADIAVDTFLKRELKAINEALWDIENRTRAKEAAKMFDQEFIELTRSVYLNNDKRAGIKRRINELLNSGLIEEKQYTSY